jgi:hypothetical protein
MGAKTLCGSPVTVGDWNEIEDWGEFEAACRKDKSIIDSAIMFSAVSWTAHKAVRAIENKPVNQRYEKSYARIRELACEIMTEHEVRKIETGIQNAIAPKKGA